nr:hypothetical protein [Tanacetum cinerariifolium]
MAGDDNNDGDHPETSNTLPPVPLPTQQIPHTEAIKSRFGGNDESKKMQKYLLKQQFEGFSVSTSEGLHKGYDRFQTLLSQLEIYGAGLDTLSFDDLYNNLRVFEHDVKGTTASSNTHNVAFVFAKNTSSMNDNNNDDIEEMDLKWQDPVGFDKTKVECFNCYKIRHFARDCRAKRNQDRKRRDAGYNGNKSRDNGRRPAYQDDSKALVTINKEDIDWLNDAMMKYKALKRKPLTKAQARKNMIIYLKNMAGYKMNYFKGMTYSEIRPLFKKHYNYNQAFLEEVNEEVKVPEKEVEVEGYKREGESLKKEITKKQKMDEEVEELKSHFQIVFNDDDVVYTEATPLASKIPIVNYKIHIERNKPYLK